MNVDNSVLATLMIINCNIPFRVVDDQYFRLFMNSTGSNWRPVSASTISTRYLKECAATVRDYIALRLRGKVACLIIDEMQKNDISFYNILLSVVNETNGNDGSGIEYYFWESKELKDGDAESIGFLIGSTIQEVRQYGIVVNCYSSDNCAVMQATQRVASAVSLTPLRRIPCASHALNNILKSLLMEDALKVIWNNVSVHCGLYH